MTGDERRRAQDAHERRARCGFGRFYDVLYYWTGEAWVEHDAPADRLGPALDELEGRGFVALRGARAVGPPEGPPSEARLAEVARKLTERGRRITEEALRAMGATRLVETPQARKPRGR